MNKAMKTLNPSGMSRKLLALAFALFALFAVNPAFAQDEEGSEGGSDSGSATGDSDEGKGKMIIGVRTGATYNKFIMSGQETDASSKRRVGFAAGVFFSYALNQWVAISPEVMFSHANARRVDYQDFIQYGKADYTLQNLQVNLLADVRMPVISVYKWKFYAGPSLDFNMAANANFEGRLAGSTAEIPPLKYDIQATEEFKGMDWGVIVGTGLDFDMKLGTLKVDARYRAGLTDINNVNHQQNFILENRTMHTSNFQFLVGFGLNL